MTVTSAIAEACTGCGEEEEEECTASQSMPVRLRPHNACQLISSNFIHWSRGK